MEGEQEILTAHYDSFYPMEVAKDGRLAAQGREIFSRIKGGPYAVAVSQVAVGETHAAVMGRYPDRSECSEMTVRLKDAILATGVGANAGARGGLRPLVPWDALEVMAGLLREVPELDGTGLVILAVALADPCSVLLITKDRTLLRNENIVRYEKLRDAGKRKVPLEITDTP